MRERIKGCRIWLAGLTILALGGMAYALSLAPDVLPPNRHVQELAGYLEALKICRPLVHGNLAIFPVVLKGESNLGGSWLTLDAAVKQGVLVVTEKEGGGEVPVIRVSNRSRNDHIFIMAGEVVSGGKQTRTIRQDVVLAPGQKVNIDVFCVEAGRWGGKAGFSTGEMFVPQSIQRELRKGTTQDRIWEEVDRTNEALTPDNPGHGPPNPTRSLECGLKAKPVAEKLERIRKELLPEMPKESVGFIFVYRGQAIGAEFFGRADLAAALLPKLVDAYAVDLILQAKGKEQPDEAKVNEKVAHAFLERIKQTGSARGKTPASGAGIQTRGGGFVGDGVGLGEALVHYGCQVEERIVPKPESEPEEESPIRR